MKMEQKIKKIKELDKKILSELDLRKWMTLGVLVGSFATYFFGIVGTLVGVSVYVLWQVVSPHLLLRRYKKEEASKHLK